MMAKGILIAAMDFSAAPEDEFHDWYDLEHIPERLRIKGFINAQRWIDVENPKVSLATYDLDQAGVLQSPPYAAIYVFGAAITEVLGRIFGPGALFPADKLLATLRSQKTPSETARIRTACRIAGGA